MLKRSKWAVFYCIVGTSALITSLDVSAQVTAYPAQGQSAQQQGIDKAACQDFAKSQTGFDPQTALQAAGTQGNQQQSHALRPRKRAKQEQKELSQQQQQSAQMQQKLQAYNKAESVCLKGRGYSVG